MQFYDCTFIYFCYELYCRSHLYSIVLVKFTKKIYRMKFMEWMTVWFWCFVVYFSPHIVFELNKLPYCTVKTVINFFVINMMCLCFCNYAWNHLQVWCVLTDVTKYLLFLAQASHELVPPDVSHIDINVLFCRICRTQFMAASCLM